MKSGRNQRIGRQMRNGLFNGISQISEFIEHNKGLFSTASLFLAVFVFISQIWFEKPIPTSIEGLVAVLAFLLIMILFLIILIKTLVEAKFRDNLLFWIFFSSLFLFMFLLTLWFVEAFKEPLFSLIWLIVTGGIVGIMSVIISRGARRLTTEQSIFAMVLLFVIFLIGKTISTMIPNRSYSILMIGILIYLVTIYFCLCRRKFLI